MAFSRKYIEPEVVYFDRSREQYFVSPDGVGGVWFESREAVFAEHGEQPVVSVSEIED